MREKIVCDALEQLVKAKKMNLKQLMGNNYLSHEILKPNAQSTRSCTKYLLHTIGSYNKKKVSHNHHKVYIWSELVGCSSEHTIYFCGGMNLFSFFISQITPRETLHGESYR